MSSGRLREFVQGFGPAWIVMIADVDAPSVLTAAAVGATYSYGLIWFFLLLIPPLFIIQEASGRIGIATGKGLGEVIRENYSRKVSAIAGIPMAVVDVVSYVAEFTGIAIGLDVVGVPPIVSMPLAYLVNLAIVLKRGMATIERILLGISAILIVSYAGSLIARGLIKSQAFYVSSTPQYFFLLAASVGAVVMPFMLFYQASATAKKGSVRLWAMRTETLVGAVASEIGMVVIAMATAGLAPSLQLSDPKALAAGLSSIAGAYAPYLFAVGLVAAAFTALVVISLASSWAMVDAFGWKKRGFYWVYAIETLPAAVVPILYPDPLNLALNLMVVFVFILIGPGVLLGLLAQNQRIMGVMASRGAWRVAYWVCLAFVISFGVIAVFALL